MLQVQGLNKEQAVDVDLPTGIKIESGQSWESSDAPAMKADGSLILTTSSKGWVVTDDAYGGLVVRRVEGPFIIVEDHIQVQFDLHQDHEGN